MNFFRTDLRVLMSYRKKIDKTRFSKLMGAVCDSIVADCIHPEAMEQNDRMFEPRTQAESDLWNMYRDLAKKDLIALKKKVQKGQEGGRPKKLTAEEKQETLQKAIRSVGIVGKNEVIITADFQLPKCEYFDSYRKTYSADELKRVVDWLKKTKLNEKVDYMWIGKQIQNFKKRNTGKIF